MPFIALVLLLALALAAPAAAQTATAGLIDEAASALRSDSVFVDPEAESALTDEEADAVRQRIRARDAGPMYIAVLPEAALDEAGGSERQALVSLANQLRRDGTYVVVAGRSIQADIVDPRFRPEVRAALDESIGTNRADGLAAILLDFVDRVGAIAAGEGVAADTPQDGRDGGGGAGGGGGLLLLGALAIGGGAIAVSRRRRRKAEAAEFEEARENVRDDLVALGEDIRALDIDVELPNTPQPVKDDYHAAVAAYERAETIWERAKSPEALAPVGAALEEGRFAMASAKSRLEGRTPPERRPPCFFDPRHGPSDRDVEWSPPYGQPRLVPACEADAQRVERGEDPEAREVMIAGHRTPYWNAGPMYAPYAGGFFGGFGGGLLPGLLMGSMLGSMMTPTVVYGNDFGDGDGDFGGDDFGGGGGDFGGGGFGGGDFGGGDFGGGGGGDF